MMPRRTAPVARWWRRCVRGAECRLQSSACRWSRGRNSVSDGLSEPVKMAADYFLCTNELVLTHWRRQMSTSVCDHLLSKTR
uniref:Uncharacterized protein n=1 Tax=Aegilops tauschii subsp. strangulata TaxID=200361 RepID=A0A453TDK1_AEGTS